MRRGAREGELRLRGLGLKARFALSITAVLTLVLSAAGYVIYAGATRIADRVETDSISEAVRYSAKSPPYTADKGFLHQKTGVQVHPFRSADGRHEGTLYSYQGQDAAGMDENLELLVPSGRGMGEDLLKFIAAILVVVVFVGAGVALWVAGQVTRPMRELIDDVRIIAKGDLHHRTNAVGAGEIELLARSIDRMTSDLGDAQEAQVELSVRERELEVAGGVREALLPLATPLIEGFDVGAAFVGASEFGGDFHDFIEREDGRIGLLVCDVSGSGVPAALVGATARSYLRGELIRCDDVLEALRRVNRWLVGDVRRGMFVTALYVLVDPAEATAEVVCAGHKIPLLRFSASDQSLRVVHPEGIALGFDKGPVFDRRIEVQKIPIEPGDRLALSNSAPVTISNMDGRELGEKAFYARVKKHSTEDTRNFLKGVRRDLEQFAGANGVQQDVSLVTIAREA